MFFFGLLLAYNFFPLKLEPRLAQKLFVRFQNCVAFSVSRCGQGEDGFLNVRDFPLCLPSPPVDSVCPNSTYTTLEIYALIVLRM